MKNKKHLWLIPVFLFLLTGCDQKTKLPKQWWEFLGPQYEEHFRGNVKSYTEKWHGVTETGEEDVVYLTVVALFDKNNNPIEENTYSVDSEWFSRKIMEYNENGDITEKREYRVNMLAEDELVTLTTYELDEKGNTLSKTTEYPSTAVNPQTDVFTYDFKNREIKVDLYLTSGELASYNVWKFNKNGLLESLTNYSHEGEQKGQYLYEYNEKGQMIQEFYNGEFEGETIFTYNEQGHVTGVDYGSNNESFEYKFDNRGNWVEKKFYWDDKLTAIRKRVYEYY